MTFFFSHRLTRWEQIKLRFTWYYIRQTRLLYPITMWWLNRGN